MRPLSRPSPFPGKYGGFDHWACRGTVDGLYRIVRDVGDVVHRKSALRPSHSENKIATTETVVSIRRSCDSSMQGILGQDLVALQYLSQTLGVCS